MEKEDHDKFARVVLWHLSNLEAAVMQLQARVIGMTDGPDPAKILEATRDSGRQVRKISETIYQNALKKSGVPSSSEYPPPFSGNGSTGGPSAKP